MNIQRLQAARWASSAYLGANVLVEDETGRLGGWNGNGYGPISPFRTITPAELAAPPAWMLADTSTLFDCNGVLYKPNGTVMVRITGQSDGGMRTVLFGDSMTDWFNYVISTATASYNSATGELTLTTASAHNLWVGSMVSVWHYGYLSLRDRRYIAVSAIPTTTTFVLTLPAGLSGVPNGALSGNTMYRPDAGRAVASVINQLQMRLGWPLNIINNGAQSGEYTGGALARLQAEVLAYAPELVIMQSLGVNDQTYSGADAPSPPLSEAQTIANNRAIYDRILASGAFLIVGTITPVKSGEARATKAIMERIQRINADLWRYAHGKNRMFVYDAYSVIVDPTNTTGLALSAMLRSDNIHYSQRGARAVSSLLAPIIQRIVPATRSTLPTSAIESHNGAAQTVSSATGSGTTVTVNMTGHGYRIGEEIRVTGMGDAAANGVFNIATIPDANSFTYDAPGLVTSGTISGTKIISRSRNIYRNNLLLTATGGTLGTGITGTAAAHIRCECANTTTSYVGVASVAADDSGFGNKQVLAVTECSNDGTPRSQFTVPGTTAYATEMAGNGRSYRLECLLRFKSTAWANTPISDVRGYLQIVGSDGKTYTGEAFYGWDGSEAASIVEDQEWHVRTPAVYVPVGVTVSSSVFLLWARHPVAISGGATFTMELARVAILDVTGL